MTWQQLEKIFNRALALSFSKRKWLLVFPVIALCGLITVICRAVSIGSTQWIQMSLTFLPIFLCSGLLLAVGLVLIRIYHNEVRGQSMQIFKSLLRSRKLFKGIPFLAVPLIFAYLVLWMVLGVFYLLREIPKVGTFLGSVFSFGPFLLVLGSIVLGILSVLILFYLTPAAALRSDLKPKLAEEILAELKTNPFLSLIMPLIGLLPLLLTAGILSIAAVMTNVLYVEGSNSFAIVMKWFFMMLPFCALVTPAIIFLFNFGCETHILMQKTAPAVE